MAGFREELVYRASHYGPGVPIGGGALCGKDGGSFRHASPSFHRTAQEAGDVVFLEEHVEEDARNHRDGDPGLQQTPVRPSDRGLLARSGEHKRQGEGHAAIHDHEGGKELVPRGDEREQRHGHYRRPDCRQTDAIEHLPAGAAVDDRGLFQLARHRLEAVPHDVDAEGDLDSGVNDGEAEDGVGQPQRREHEEQRRDQRLVAGEMIRAKARRRRQSSLSRNREAGERVAGRNGQHKAEGVRQECRGGAVEEVDRQAVLVVPQLDVAAEAEFVREPRRRDRRLLHGGLQRCDDGQHQRCEHDRANGHADGADHIFCAPLEAAGPERSLRVDSALTLALAHAWARREKYVCSTVQKRMTTARMSDSAAP